MADQHAHALARPGWIGLAGPTAAGKTAAALALAQRWPVEIISVDSALVYRGMDIGTAKPTAAERREVAHHLVDIIDPAQAYSAAQFVRDAQRLIVEVQARGRTPLLVGGTMMYFKALIHGLDELPAADPTVRAQIDLEAQRLGWPALHEQLQAHDPATAQRLAPTDAQRIQRALEVYRITGRPLSSYHHRADQNLFAAAHLISLEPTDRAWLHRRIEQRFSQMLEQGLVGEVIALRARGDLHEGLPSMRCVGYRQVWETLAGVQPENSLLARGVAATRQLAKRQLTWLRAMPWRVCVPCDADEAIDLVVDAWAQQLPPARGH